MYELTCPNCNKVFQTKDKRAKFCCRSCSATYTNKNKVLSEKHKQNISLGLKKHFDNHPEKIRRGDEAAQDVAKGTRGKFRDQLPNSILELSNRTANKILKRMKLACSRCGWNEAPCDLHHIKGRKIEDCDNHSNLSYLCPNCHRLAHNNLIKSDELITFDQYVGDKWTEYYYG